VVTSSNQQLHTQQESRCFIFHNFGTLLGFLFLIYDFIIEFWSVRCHGWVAQASSWSLSHDHDHGVNLDDQFSHNHWLKCSNQNIKNANFKTQILEMLNKCSLVIFHKPSFNSYKSL
jgi:hypothetical protein